MGARTYRSIKELVFDIIRQTKGLADYETVTKKVRNYFPTSKWKQSHWGYYRSQITSEIGRYKDEFPEKIKANLRRGRNSRGRPRKKVKLVLKKKKKEICMKAFRQGDTLI